MLKRLLFILLISVSCIAQAQIRVQEAFLTMPDTLCPFLEKQQRYYLLTSAQEEKYDTVVNQFNGKSTLIQQTANTLRIHIADGIEYDLLTQHDTITFIQTACAPICSSIVKQYTADWQYIRTITLPLPGTFVEAQLQDGKIIYHDNTPALLDENEKKEYTF